MKQYQERLFRERKDLVGRIKKAKQTISAVPYGIDKHQIMLLAEQVKVMEQYLSILDERIDYEKTFRG